MTPATSIAKAYFKRRSASHRKAGQLPWVTIIVITAVVLGALFAPWLTPYDPYTPDLGLRLLPPSTSHLFGTDSLGRDVLTRLLFGARITLLVVLLTLVAGGVVGITLGIVAGYFRGITDTFISRFMDSVLAFPTIFFGLVLSVTLGPGLASVSIAISLVMWARFARVIRDEVVSLRERDFIARAKVSGCSPLRILAVHVLPNVLSPAMVIVSINMGHVILLEASLSYLGAGIPPPTPSWGGMISEGQNYIGSAWWISITPGIAIGLTVLALSVLGDWLRERLDPHLRDLV